MQTTSVLIHSLCVPCHNHCRHCLLSWNGRVEGAGWDRSVALAERFLDELRARQPEIAGGFSFGYSMEHPDLKGAVRTLRRLGGPTADFLQCDGMKMRDETECAELMGMLRDEGIKRLNFTLYGLSDYHDRFAGRKGDFELLMRMMRAAKASRLPFSTGIPLTAENIRQVDDLAGVLRETGSEKVFLTVPHEEGRGKLLRGVRLGMRDFSELSAETQTLLNRMFIRIQTRYTAMSLANLRDFAIVVVLFMIQPSPAFQKRNIVSDVCYYSTYSLLNKEEFKKIAIRKHCILKSL